MYSKKNPFLFVAQQPKSGLGRLVVEVSRLHTDTRTHAHTRTRAHTHTHTNTPTPTPTPTPTHPPDNTPLND